jgi:hypothetical protein
MSLDALDTAAIRRAFAFPGRSRGTMFSSLYQELHFLDGGIAWYSGYGFGSHSWAVVQGAEALRGLCLCTGVRQPRLIKGEAFRRPLSLLLEDMTKKIPIDTEGAFLLSDPEMGPRG